MLNNTNYYTIFDLPISVTNKIDFGLRPSCDSLSNPVLPPETIDYTGADTVGILFAPGDARQIDAKPLNKDGDGKGQGLGDAGAGMLEARSGLLLLTFLAMALAVVVG